MLRPSRTRLAVTTATLATAAALAASAPAALADPACQPSGSDVVCTFATPGATTWTMPAGVTEAAFDVYGAQGGNLGANGGRASATMPVTSDDTLQINVGGAGGAGNVDGGSGGVNGGGPGGGSGGGGGGGASDVRSGGLALADRIIVAGGGGSDAGGSGGLGGGTMGANNGDGGRLGDGGLPGGGGRGATVSAAGAGGTGGSGLDGAAGRFGGGGRGGAGIHYGTAAGGGGGGYYGGGGGGGGGGSLSGGGGGVGSSFGAPSAVFDDGVRSGDGLVTITYTPDTTAPTTTTALSPPSPGGQNGWYTSAVHATVAASDGSGSGVSETRCVLDPPNAPVSFADLPGACPYLGEGADVTGDGRHTLYAASKDAAGNTETPQATSIKIDSTPPTVTCAPAPTFVLNQTAASVAATVTDSTSGPANSAASATASTASVGAHSADVTGTDNAGNQATATCAYLVTYAFGGFTQPVDNLDPNGHPILNVVKGGPGDPAQVAPD